MPLDPEAILEWAQRAIRLFGNAIFAMSTERQKSSLMHIDHKLAELTPTEPGSLANCLFLWDKSVEYISTFSALGSARAAACRTRTASVASCGSSEAELQLNGVEAAGETRLRRS
ncbi:hypothetical protein NDU88_007526 [Pleurodeles waltl]|uniref:Uncharacterized protein n=1 Tax=Pleurodeles waltl TaxID=8319 RepID=A0AAV7N3P5_PLEWA|nr:hypothetical protein NDU88_007526 [Pleurodeles waltl]